MPQSCKVCQLGPTTVKQLELDYINGINLLQIAKTYGVKRDSVAYHLEHHLPKRIVQGAKETLQIDSTHLVEQIDQLYSWMKIIFQRNYEKGYDKTALKALAEQRNTLQLLAQISVALHKTKVAELEHEEQRHLMESNIPLERLTKREQEVYFQITQKLLGDDTVTIDLGYTDFSDMEIPTLRKRVVEEESKVEKTPEVHGESYVEDQNTSNNPPPSGQLIRRRRTGQEEEQMQFKPIPKSPPVKDPQVTKSRALISKAFDQFEEKQFPNTPGSPIF